MTAAAEELHEIGRRGVLEAKAVLEGILPGAVDLSFNAYDASHILTFEDSPDFGGQAGSFVLDLGGVLKRKEASMAAGKEVTPVFVEVKTRGNASGVFGEYKEFLRRAAIISRERRHKNAWFVFYCTVPFGTSSGSELVDGTLLEKCSASWPSALKEASKDLDARIVLVIATKSFVNMLTSWSQHAQ